MNPLDTPMVEIFASNVYCIGSRQDLIEKMEKALAYLKERTNAEFENIHLIDGGIIVKIVSLEIKNN